ncbi:MAG TPA: CpsD/CapB family tyrosine-protein kinase [Terriglobales bacterium]|jgi:protein-tyrosine kinase|nr:CpsD/CapB family tyrosine-protein kinase [Terriglobales bacterium]
MSRIHEALKKAEQERASSQGVPSESTPLAEREVEHSPAFSSATAVQSAPNPASETMPAFTSQVTADTLLARCAQGNWNPDPKVMLFVSGDDQKAGTEEFRTLRSRLCHMRESGTLKKLLVTSALPKEGKSFVALNLAQVLVRQHGRRILLIDGDLRGPRLHQSIGTESTPGLVNYLTGESDEFSIIQRGSIDNLFFLPAGRAVSNAPELVSNGRLKLLMQRVEPLFDWIILDSPPAVPVADASQLAKYCDGVLMVVRSNTTPVDMARKARQEFSDKQLVGVVLNGISEDASDYYSRYYYGPVDGSQA